MRQWTTLHKYIWLRILQGANAVYETVKGAIISFTTKKAAPLTELKVEFSPVQDLHGYDSPWPAGGGKNKFYLWGNGYINTSGGFSPQDNNGCAEKMPVTEGETWTFSATTRGSYSVNMRGWWFDADDHILGSNLQGTNTLTVTAPSGAASVWFYFSVQSYSDKITQEFCDTLGIQIEKSASATSYAPYSNECPISGWTGATVWVKDEYDTTLPATISVTFPAEVGTVYSGTYNFVTGDGVITTKAVDMGDLGWVAATSGGNRVFYAELVNLGGKVAPTLYGLCSCYATKVGLPYEDGSLIMYGSTAYNFSRIGIRDDACAEMTATEFKNHVAGQTLVFELEAPTSFSTTPTPINSLVGENNVWSNANGDIEATYRSN